MNRAQLEHLLRAAGNVLGEKQFIVIGSQSILGKFPNAPEMFTFSAEADLISKNKTTLTYMLEAIGEASRFHDEHGYYVDPVDATTAILPLGWKSRLIHVSSPATQGVTGLCLDPHDLFISKIAAGRPKDMKFVKGMVHYDMIDKEQLLGLAAKVPNPADDRQRAARITAAIERLYGELGEQPDHRTPNVEVGRYVGPVVSVSASEVVQEIGRGTTVSHHPGRLDTKPLVGRSYLIQYQDGHAKVQDKTSAQTDHHRK